MHAAPRIRKIEFPDDAPRNSYAAIVSNVRKKLPFWLYRLLKGFIPFRQTARLCVRYGYYVYRLFVHENWLFLVKQADYIRINNIPVIILAKAATVLTPPARIVPAACQHYLTGLREHYEFPEIYVATIQNAVTIGRTHLIVVGDKVLCHDLFTPKRDHTFEELTYRAQIEVDHGRIQLASRDRNPVRIPVAATFTDACAVNYAHWMTEVLPRIALFCSDERFKGIPIIIDDGLHPNQMESLYAFADDGREIIVLVPEREITVDRLYVVSVAGYVPYERRPGGNPEGHSQGYFSPDAFALIRSRLLAKSEDDTQKGPKKIFIRRTTTGRKLINAAEVEALLIAEGYTSVEPETLSCAEQAEMFHNATHIVGSSGAAMANILFTRPDAKICIMIGQNPDTSYGYWQNIACAAGAASVVYVLGQCVEGSPDGIHTDFTVDPNLLLKAIGSNGTRHETAKTTPARFRPQIVKG